MLKSMDEIVAAATRSKGNRHYFSPDTMRFFKGRVMSTVFPIPGGAVFVTSERGPGMERRYTIRTISDDGENVATIGEFQQYASRSGAMRAAGRHANTIINAEPASARTAADKS